MQERKQRVGFVVTPDLRGSIVAGRLIETANGYEVQLSLRHRFEQFLRLGIAKLTDADAQLGRARIAADAAHSQDEQDEESRDNDAVWPFDEMFLIAV